MPTTSTSPPADYRAATESVAIYPVPNPGYLLISGETRREYIQRQTTNDIDLLSPTRVLPTMLTAPTGRILEYYVLLEHGDSIAMLTQPGHGPGNATYFQKRIFFNDNVTIHDRSSKWVQIELSGPKAPDLLMGLGFSHPPGLEEILECNWQGVELRTFGVTGFGPIDRFRLLAPSSQLNQVTKELSNCPTLSFSSREILRIEGSHAGDPELSAETTPFELGMDRLVSTTKGCYTGQEVLARQVTYDKVVRRLVRLSAEHPMPAGESLSFDGKSVGQITSATVSPRLGPIALGIVRKPHDEAGTNLLLQSQESSFEVAVV